MESKEDKFKRIAGRRVQQILEALRLLGNCSNRSNYAYHEEDLKKVFLIIEAETRRVKALYDGPRSKRKEFKLW